jgi:hypothetical protein
VVLENDGPIVREVKYYTESRSRKISYKQQKRRKANWIGHILRRNCFLNEIIKGKIKGRTGVTGRRGKRRKQLPDDLKEKRGYLKMKEEALDCTLENSLWKKHIWTCRKTDNEMNE